MLGDSLAACPLPFLFLSRFLWRHLDRLRRSSHLLQFLGQRLKLSGMRWSEPGATGIMTLRSAADSGRWDQICPSVHNQKAAA